MASSRRRGGTLFWGLLFTFDSSVILGSCSMLVSSFRKADSMAGQAMSWWHRHKSMNSVIAFT